MVVATLIL
jgi:uncharacterized small protein (DUF1192 family)